MRGTFYFSFDKKEQALFKARCDAAVRNVASGSKKATVAACEEILKSSMEQVPKYTQTLLSSAFYAVTRRIDTSAKHWSYEAIIGYGGNGDPINPKTGEAASHYMLAVHENLAAVHPIGKAKFLEDPVKEYAANNFKRTIFAYAKQSLSDMSD